MAVFPGSIPSFTGFTSSHTLAQDNHAAQHNLEQGEIVQIATKIGTGSSTPVANTFLGGTGTGTSAWRQVALTTDITGILPVANGGTGANSASQARSNLGLNTSLEILAAAYPIGSIYINATDSTNPSTLLGFGTWVSFGAGRVMVGNGTSDQAFSAGATGGESTHVLSASEMPTHSLTMSHHGDEGGSVVRQFNGTNGTSSGTTLASTYRTSSAPVGGAASIQSPTITWGSDAAHNNLQPYIVVYFWKRTA